MDKEKDQEKTCHTCKHFVFPKLCYGICLENLIVKQPCNSCDNGRRRRGIGRVLI